ncbi:MAG: methylenetetrahydrofolate reductase C-terminal domain-containing protein [Candidatus Omnitrophota bacterium]
MIITKSKNVEEIVKHLGSEKNVFLVGCGECSTTCKTGGEADIKALKEALQKRGKAVTGFTIPDAPCIAAKVKLDLAKNRKAVEAADSIIVLACGLGIQSVKENSRVERPVHVGCDTLFMGRIDKDGAFEEVCSGCGDCVLETTDLICPVTRCSKSLMNGPCGGQDKGKCEVDKERDCAWIMIYNGLKKKGKLDLLRQIQKPKDYSVSVKPRKRVLEK